MKRYDYQPGNATRYDLLYGPIEGEDRYALVYFDRGGGGVALRFCYFDNPHPAYIKEKMRLCFEGDADALAQFIAERHSERMAAHKEAS